MKTNKIIYILVSAFSFFANAETNIDILNSEFEAVKIPSGEKQLNHIAGWVSSGSGSAGIYKIIGGGWDYYPEFQQGQVAFVEHNGRISTNTNELISKNTLYTLKFKVGARLDQLGIVLDGSSVVARIKSKGLVLSQLHSNEFSTALGEWREQTLYYLSTNKEEVGGKLVLEFQNLASEQGYQVNIDEISLTKTPFHVEEKKQPLLIQTDYTVSVPEQFNDINTAMAHLADKRFVVGKKVNIQVSDCSNQNYDEAIIINHKNSKQFYITGKPEEPSSCILNFNSSDGFVITGGSVGQISGFKLTGSNTHGTAGIKVNPHTKTNLRALQVSNFGYGLFAQNNATILAKELTASNNSIAGIYATNRSFIKLSNSKAISNYYGMQANNNSLIQSSDILISENTDDGIFVENNSQIDSINDQILNNGKNGISASKGSFISAEKTTIQGNHAIGVLLDGISSSQLKEVVSSQNAINFSPEPDTYSNNNSHQN